MIPVLLKYEGKERHGIGCRCGRCNANGHAYIYYVYAASGVDVDDEEARYELLSDPDLRLTYVSAPSETAAEHAARRYCERFNYEIKE